MPRASELAFLALTAHAAAASSNVTIRCVCLETPRDDNTVCRDLGAINGAIVCASNNGRCEDGGDVANQKQYFIGRTSTNPKYPLQFGYDCADCGVRCWPEDVCSDARFQWRKVVYLVWFIFVTFSVCALYSAVAIAVWLYSAWRWCLDAWATCIRGKVERQPSGRLSVKETQYERDGSCQLHMLSLVLTVLVVGTLALALRTTFVGDKVWMSDGIARPHTLCQDEGLWWLLFGSFYTISLSYEVIIPIMLVGCAARRPNRRLSLPPRPLWPSSALSTPSSLASARQVPPAVRRRLMRPSTAAPLTFVTRTVWIAVLVVEFAIRLPYNLGCCCWLNGCSSESVRDESARAREGGGGPLTGFQQIESRESPWRQLMRRLVSPTLLYLQNVNSAERAFDYQLRMQRTPPQLKMHAQVSRTDPDPRNERRRIKIIEQSRHREKMFRSWADCSGNLPDVRQRRQRVLKVRETLRVDPFRYADLQRSDTLATMPLSPCASLAC